VRELESERVTSGKVTEWQSERCESEKVKDVRE